jgi:hypothetical protein
MTVVSEHHPVELLRDGRGVYGIGGYDTLHPGTVMESMLILRRDRIGDGGTFTSHYKAALHQITGGFRRGLFSHTVEDKLRQAIHHDLLRRRGLPWPPNNDLERYRAGERYWAFTRAQQNRNRQIYHGLRIASLGIVNKLIRQALAEAADPDALKLARRFLFADRYKIYRAATLSLRARQVAEAFPALALVAYAEHQSRELELTNSEEIRALIEVGAPLQRVAEAARIPTALRRVKPQAAHIAVQIAKICARDPRLFHAHMPDSLPRVKLWLWAIYVADSCGAPFAEWTAKHCLEMGGTADQVLATLTDIKDWIRAGYRASVPDPFQPESPGDALVTRPFCETMSLKTVMRLSAEWHEAVANNVMLGADHQFPEPWYPAGRINAFEIVPITTAADLYREGKAMHHCVARLSLPVRQGECCVYSIRNAGERVATLQLIRSGDRALIGQLRGHCNALVPKEIDRTARIWLRSQRAALPERYGLHCPNR